MLCAKQVVKLPEIHVCCVDPCGSSFAVDYPPMSFRARESLRNARKRANGERVKFDKPWTRQELVYLTTHWQIVSMRTLTRELGRSGYGVSLKAKELGLPKMTGGVFMTKTQLWIACGCTQGQIDSFIAWARVWCVYRVDGSKPVNISREGAKCLHYRYPEEWLDFYRDYLQAEAASVLAARYRILEKNLLPFVSSFFPEQMSAPRRPKQPRLFPLLLVDKLLAEHGNKWADEHAGKQPNRFRAAAVSAAVRLTEKGSET